MTTATRYVEKQVIDHLLTSIIAKGYSISVYDGEEKVVVRSRDKTIIDEAMFSVDDEVLYIHDPAKDPPLDNLGWVRLVYGNEGWDVINDYTVNLDALFMDDVNRWIDTNQDQ